MFKTYAWLLHKIHTLLYIKNTNYDAQWVIVHHSNNKMTEKKVFQVIFLYFKKLPKLQICQSRTVRHSAALCDQNVGRPLPQEDACSQIWMIWMIICLTSFPTVEDIFVNSGCSGGAGQRPAGPDLRHNSPQTLHHTERRHHFRHWEVSNLSPNQKRMF